MVGCSCFLPFSSSSFFSSFFFVDRPTNDHVLCGDLFLGKFKRKRNEEAYCSVPVVEAAEFGIRKGGGEKRCIVIVDSSVP